MADLPFDPADPPDEPPAGVLQPMLWRLAVRLHRDHTPVTEPVGSGACRICGDRWPCRGRRIAERGLAAAFLDPRRSPAAGPVPGPAGRRSAGPPAAPTGTS